ncbi:MAG: HAD hydrolase-like protein [Planctomycetota bacterium]
MTHASHQKLVLFDLDGTVVNTFGAGLRALSVAAQRIFGAELDPATIVAAGRLDPEIMADLLERFGRTPAPEGIAAYHAGYREALPEALAHTGATVCPGVPELMAALGRRPEVTLGVLTGNYADTGSIKMRACGVDPARFPIHVWADDADPEAPARAQLPAVALDRFAAMTGAPIDPLRAIIIGDTPADIACARANGCRVIAVATGPIAKDELAAHEPDLLLDDLTDAGRVIDFTLADAAPADSAP